MKRKIIMISLTLALMSSGILFLSCRQGGENSHDLQAAAESKAAEKKILYYTCGMHPSVRVKPEDFEAGDNKCPICKMDLVPVYAESGGQVDAAGQEHTEHTPVESLLTLSPQAQALAGVKTEKVEYRHLFKEIKTVGQMVWDERRLAYVAARIPGRLDKLYVNFTGARVKQGSPLALIYSPDLLITQEEYLLALETLEKVGHSPDGEAVKGAEALVAAARKRLSLWGIDEAQIKELEENRRARTHMTVPAPIGGTVILKNAVAGKYVKEGENLFQIADLSHLWMEADIYEYEMGLAKLGQSVSLVSAAYPGEKFSGKIAFIEPYLDPRTRSVKARVDVPNSQGKLKPGMYMNASIEAHIHGGDHSASQDTYSCPMCPEVLSDKPGECPNCGMDLVKNPPPPAGTVLAVPKEAVLDTGLRKLVYIEQEAGAYTAREVELGQEATALVEGRPRPFYVVTAGLSEGLSVVTRANFLIDSQSQITGQAEAVYSGALEKGQDKKPPAKHIH